MTEITFFLFYKPESYLSGNLSTEGLINLKNYLNEVMDSAIKSFEILKNDGWEQSMGLYDISFFKKEKMSESQVKEYLESKKLNPDDFWCRPNDEEDFEEDFEESSEGDLDKVGYDGDDGI